MLQRQWAYVYPTEQREKATSPAAVLLYSIVVADGMLGLTQPEVAVQQAVLGCMT